MKECREIRELMSTALDGELASAEQARLDGHLAGCPRCRGALAELRATVQLIKEVEPVEPPPWLAAKIMARLRSEAVPRRPLWQRLFLPLPVKLPLQTAALVVLCITGYYLAKSTAPQVELSPPPGVVQQEERPPAPTAPSQVPQGAPSPTPPRKAAPSAESPQKPRPGPGPVQEYAPPPPPPPPSPVPAPSAPSPLPAAPPAAQPFSPLLNSQDGEGAAHRGKAAKARRQPEQAAPAPARQEEMLRGADSLRTGAAAAPPTAIFRLTVNDAAAADQTIVDQLRALGATITNRQERSITARLEAARLAELEEGLARLGTLRDKPALPAGATGPLLVTISW
jgi:hypothetical protein